MNRKWISIFYTVALLFAGNAVAGEKGVVAVIGTGDMGDSLGPRFAQLGYQVVYGSRSPDSDKVKTLLEKTGHGASATTQQEAAAQGDIVLTLIPWPAMETVARNLGDLSGKIIIDVSMPFAQGEDGYPQHMLETSSGEMIQAWNPDAKVVKTFATLGSFVIDDPASAGGIVSVPIASDHKDAKEKVARIVADMGFDPVDFGPIRMSREIEIMQMIYMIPLIQNRPEHWEFFFRRADYFGCYRADEYTTEGIVPPIDDNDFAEFPPLGEAPADCP